MSISIKQSPNEITITVVLDQERATKLESAILKTLSSAGYEVTPVSALCYLKPGDIICSESYEMRDAGKYTIESRGY